MATTEWRTIPLSDFVRLKRGFDLPAKDRVKGRYPVVGSAGVSGWHSEGPVEGPGVVVGRSGSSMGHVTYVDEDFWPLNTAMFVEDFLSNDSRYVYLALSCIDFSAFNSGSAQPSLNRNFISRIPIKVPSPAEQQAIAEVLGALNGKIALNERHAETALELAGCLYENESVAQGRWSELALGDTAKWLSGGTPRTSEPSYWGGDIPWISAVSLKTPWLHESERSVTELGAQNGTRLVPKGSILFVVRGMSLTTEFRVGVAQREVAFGQDCKALIPHVGIDSSTLFLAIRAQSAKILGMVDLAGHGTGRLVTERVANLRVRLPQGDDAAEFAARAGALMARAVAVTNENRTLADLRDTLLPQLLSGKIRVKDAVRSVEEVV